MRITIISGSHRRDSRSGRLAQLLARHLPTLAEGAEARVVDLAHTPLPLWDEAFPTDGAWEQSEWASIRAALAGSDGIVAVCPEWGGMVPPALKNFFLLSSHRELGHKPGLIVAVSAGRGGAYPVAELRISSYKNNRLCWLPEHVIVRDAEEVIAAGEGAQKEGQPFPRSWDRLDYGLRLLVAYADAMRQIREAGIIDHERFANGM